MKSIYRCTQLPGTESFCGGNIQPSQGEKRHGIIPNRPTQSRNLHKPKERNIPFRATTPDQSASDDMYPISLPRSAALPTPPGSRRRQRKGTFLTAAFHRITSIYPIITVTIARQVSLLFIRPSLCPVASI